MSRFEAEAKGRRAEKFAALWLRLHGWRILGQRVRVAHGEVDIIARRGKTLAFIEVKWRATAAELDLAIDQRRLSRVVAAAQILAPRYMKPNDDVRIDVMLLAPKRLPRHLIHVWQ
jgi:putative endonuclease